MLTKNLLTPKTKNIIVSFDKFNENLQNDTNKTLISESQCSECYNYSTKKGRLEDGYGIQRLTGKSGEEEYVVEIACEEIKGIWATTWINEFNNKIDDYVFFMTEDNTIDYLELSMKDVIISTDEVFTEVPVLNNIVASEEPVFAFTSPVDNVYVITADNAFVYTDLPKFLSVCYHYDKTFAVTAEISNALVYSTERDITNWEGLELNRMEFFDARGRLLKLLCFNDNLYIFREFGITKVSQYSMKAEFGIDHLYQSQSYIYPETISICGDKVFFMTRDGLYEFNGTNVSKVKLECLKRADLCSANAVAVSYDGLYFMALKMNFEDELIGCEADDFTNNAVVIYDCASENVEILRGVDIKQFAVVNSCNKTKLLAIFRGQYKNLVGEFVKNGKIFDEPTFKKWRSGFCDFGYPNKLKHINEIHVLTSSDCSLTIKSETESKTYEIKGSERPQRIKASVKGKLFETSFKASCENQKLSYANLSVTVYQ